MYRSFKEMPIWQSGMKIAEIIFKLTSSLPKQEDYVLTSQLRRSALSISANIAEAFGRKHISNKVNFYYFARGSITETLSHLEYGLRVEYFDKKDILELNISLNALIKDINKLVSSFSQAQP